jgi:hypothetical protein
MAGARWRAHALTGTNVPATLWLGFCEDEFPSRISRRCRIGRGLSRLENKLFRGFLQPIHPHFLICKWESECDRAKRLYEFLAQLRGSCKWIGITLFLEFHPPLSANLHRILGVDKEKRDISFYLLFFSEKVLFYILFQPWEKLQLPDGISQVAAPKGIDCDQYQGKLIATWLVAGGVRKFFSAASKIVDASGQKLNNRFIFAQAGCRIRWQASRF